MNSLVPSPRALVIVSLAFSLDTIEGAQLSLKQTISGKFSNKHSTVSARLVFSKVSIFSFIFSISDPASLFVPFVPDTSSPFSPLSPSFSPFLHS